MRGGLQKRWHIKLIVWTGPALLGNFWQIDSIPQNTSKISFHPKAKIGIIVVINSPIGGDVHRATPKCCPIPNASRPIFSFGLALHFYKVSSWIDHGLFGRFDLHATQYLPGIVFVQLGDVWRACASFLAGLIVCARLERCHRVAPSTNMVMAGT